MLSVAGAEPSRQPVLIEPGADADTNQVHRQHYRKTVNRVLEHLAQHSHHQNFIADTQQAAAEQNQCAGSGGRSAERNRGGGW